MRADVYDGSAMETKQTSLSDKIGKIKNKPQRNVNAEHNREDIIREKVVVEAK